jgi:hypothetical protein
MRPAGRFEEFLAEITAVNNTGREGPAYLLTAARVINRFPDVEHPTPLPRALDRALFAILAAAGKLLGLRIPRTSGPRRKPATARKGPLMNARKTGRTRGAIVPTKIGYGLSGLLGAGIIVIGARFLVAPQAAAAAYGITNEQGGPASDPFLAVKGVRDIASGVVTLVLLAAGKPHILGRYLAAASIIPIGDATHSAAAQRPEGNRLRGARHHRGRHARHGRAPTQRTRMTFLSRRCPHGHPRPKGPGPRCPRRTISTA